jgi:transposase
MNYTISQFKKNFPNDDACLEFLFKARFSNFKCPKCGKNKFYRIKNRKCYNCISGDYQIYPLKGTIFSGSSGSLFNWFYALYRFSTSKNGVSAKELQGVLNITYKTAWRISFLIRSLMKQDKNKLDGTIEADITYMGGRKKGGHAFSGKPPVMGIVQRGGGIKLKHIPNSETQHLLGALRENIKLGSRVITDDTITYRPNKITRLGLLHDKINHSKEEYVKGDIYTNTIEGFFSQMKRSINGTYHAVSRKYLQSYVDLFAFHRNQRFASVSAFETLLLRLCGLPETTAGQSVPFGVKVSS